MRDSTINYNFVIRVKHLMELLQLPYPRRRNVIKNDDEILPIITGGYYKC